MTSEEQLTQLFNEKLTGISAKIDAYNDLTMLELKHIRMQTEKTNGRVNKLEESKVNVSHCRLYNEKLDKVAEETLITRWFERKPVRYGLIVGVILLINIPEVRDFLFGWI